MDDKALGREARDFAGRLSGLLNRTVCDGIRISSVVAPSKGLAFVGYGVGLKSLSADPFPIHRCRATTGLYLILSYTLTSDDEGEHLTVQSSVLGMCLDPSGVAELFHADYERNKADGYAEAHLQVGASSEHWAALLESTDEERALSKLHLPAGGRRFRTTVEDLIDFLVSERLVTPRDGWEEAVREQREDFEERQLKAAVRRNPKAAIDILRQLGEI